MRLERGPTRPPFGPSFMPAMYTSPVTRSPVIWALRMNVAPPLTSTGLLQVAPPSVEWALKMSALGKLKSFQETYIVPKKGEDGLLSAQPDSRSSKVLL